MADGAGSLHRLAGARIGEIEIEADEIGFVDGAGGIAVDGKRIGGSGIDRAGDFPLTNKTPQGLPATYGCCCVTTTVGGGWLAAAAAASLFRLFWSPTTAAADAAHDRADGRTFARAAGQGADGEAG